MSQVLYSEVKELVLSNSSFGPGEIEALKNAISHEHSDFGVLRDSVAELDMQEDRSPATSVRLGVCQYLLGRYQSSIETLTNADGGALAHFYMGKCHLSLKQFDKAAESLESAKVAGYDSDCCELTIAEAYRLGGDSDKAMQKLDSLSGAVEQTAEYLYQRGSTVSAQGGNPEEVVALYERATSVDGKHAGALFGLALENDRRGNDETAMDLYGRAASGFPAHVGTLLNLGILYEDRDNFAKARQCYMRIIDSYPNHPQARLYAKDAEASGDMFFDEEAQKERERLQQMLSIPVTDFELSVRSRNCLQKMGIYSLGDLTRCDEMELLSSKNFGETSLVEIREMLESRGLRLGQFADERAEPEPEIDTSSMTPDEQALLDRPISHLNLSVRARKCMVRLGISTINELIRKSGDDMLECKNFGVTSLNEVREKLTLQNLKLRGD